MPDGVNVVLTDANVETPGRVLKAIVAVLRYLDPDARAAHFRTAQDLWERFEAGDRPLVLAHAETAEQAREAASAGLAASAGNVVIGTNLSEDDLAAAAAEHEPEPESGPTPPSKGERMDPTSILPLMADQPAEDWTPSIEAAKAALVLMATADGNAQATIATARMLRHATGSEVWEDVVRLALAAFPVMER